MTLLTDDFVFIHVPKTGGTFITTLFTGSGPNTVARTTPEYLPARWHATCPGPHWTAARIPASHKHLPHLAARRNPWSWYVSWYEFHKWQLSIPGDRRHVKNTPWARASAIGTHGFKDTVRNVLDAGGCTRTHQRYLRLDKNLESTLGTDITYIRQEHLRQDLCDFLRRFDEIPPEMEKEIMEGPRRNVQVERDYRTYYDDKTIELIANVDKTFIEKFGYAFEE